MCKGLENDTSFSILHLVGVIIEEKSERINSFRGKDCQNAYQVGRKVK